MINFVDEIVGGDGVRRYNLIKKDGTVIENDVEIKKAYTPTQEGSKYGAAHASDTLFKKEGGDILGTLSIKGKDVLTNDPEQGNVTLLNNWNMEFDQLYRVGRMVFLNLVLYINATTPGGIRYSVAQLPEGFRPMATQTTVSCETREDLSYPYLNNIVIWIADAGNISICATNPLSANTRIPFNVSFIAAE